MTAPVRLRRPLGDRAPEALLYYGADCRETLRDIPEGSVHCVVTSPPYWGLRSYLDDEDAHKGNELGLEQTPEEYVEKMVEVFREVRRVLRDDGTLWLNLGDSYAQARGHGHWESRGDKGDEKGQKVAQRWAKMGAEDIGLKPKDLVGIPWMVAFALRSDGWYLRSDIVWSKPACMPESVTDRPTKSHEYLFLLAKSQRYFYDAEAVKEPDVSGHGSGTVARKGNRQPGERSAFSTNVPWEGVGHGRNRRTVWSVNPRPYRGAHFAVFPPELVEPCILAGTSERGCCPACGSPWRRLVERQPKPTERHEVLPNERDGGITAEQGMERSGMSHFKYNEWLKQNPPRTVAWEPTCECDAGEPVPCTVLDPFSGSGTAGQVALDQGRAYVGLDLNTAYLDLASARILGERPPASAEEAGDTSILEFFT